jgi:hypothetical protein
VSRRQSVSPVPAGTGTVVQNFNSSPRNKKTLSVFGAIFVYGNWKNNPAMILQ